jgi:putative MATE family efflux protein
VAPTVIEGQTIRTEPSLWTTIRESLAGSHHGSYTEGSIDRAIVLLAIPMVLELVLESVFAVADVFFVARVGPDAVATVGLTEATMTVVYAVAMGLGMGATAIVARRMGEEDPDGAAIAAVQAIAIGLLFAVPLGLLGFSFARPILALMGAPDVLAHSSFTAILIGFNGVILMLFLINAVFRGAGDAAIAMRVLWIANAINICLDPCLIFGLGPFPRLGVTGAAVATTTGRSVGVLVQLWYLSRRDGRLAIRPRHLRLDPAVMLNMLRLSGSAVFQMLIGTTSYIGVMRIIASFGSVSVAACTIVIRIIMFVLMPSWGLSNAAATLVGQNLGAGHPGRAAASAWRACWLNVAVLGALGVLFVAFADVVVGWFTHDPRVAPIATLGLRIISGGFPFYAAGYVLTQSFNGAGDTWTPTLISLGCFWCFEIPCAYVLGVSLGFGPPGVFWAMNIAFSVMSIVAAALFRRGTWQLKRV